MKAPKARTWKTRPMPRVTGDVAVDGAGVLASLRGKLKRWGSGIQLAVKRSPKKYPAASIRASPTPGARREGFGVEDHTGPRPGVSPALLSGLAERCGSPLRLEDLAHIATDDSDATATVGGSASAADGGPRAVDAEEEARLSERPRPRRRSGRPRECSEADLHPSARRTRELRERKRLFASISRGDLEGRAYRLGIELDKLKRSRNPALGRGTAPTDDSTTLGGGDGSRDLEIHLIEENDRYVKELHELRQTLARSQPAEHSEGLWEDLKCEVARLRRELAEERETVATYKRGADAEARAERLRLEAGEGPALESGTRPPKIASFVGPPATVGLPFSTARGSSLSGQLTAGARGAATEGMSVVIAAVTALVERMETLERNVDSRLLALGKVIARPGALPAVPPMPSAAGGNRTGKLTTTGGPAKGRE